MAAGGALIQLIYEGVTDDAAWTAALAMIAKTVRSAGAGLGVQNMATHEFWAVAQSGVDPALHGTYERLAPENLIWQAISRAGQPMADQMVMPKQQFLCTALHAEYFVPQGFHSVMAAPVLANGGILDVDNNAPFNSGEGGSSLETAVAPSVRPAPAPMPSEQPTPPPAQSAAGPSAPSGTAPPTTSPAPPAPSAAQSASPLVAPQAATAEVPTAASSAPPPATTQPAGTAAASAAPQPLSVLPTEAEMSAVDRRQVQEALHRSDYYKGPVDGIFGPLTRAAIRRFQQGIGSDATGYLTADQANRLVTPR